jgi:Holliday junction resolvasome RuvABC endonuclease subunit
MIRSAKKYGFTVLCLDPSITAFGWAVMRQNELIDSGCIKTEPSKAVLHIRKGDDRCRRINDICYVLNKKIKEHSICYVVSEQPHGSQSASAAIMIGITLGLIVAICNTIEIGVEWYSEGESKKNLLGKASATKLETLLAIDKLYKVPKTKGIARNRKGEVIALWSGISYIDEAVADALSVYHIAKKESSFIKAMLK